MNILHFCPHMGGVMYEWHKVHFIDELTRAGHTVTDCNPIQVLGRITSKSENSDILYSMAKKLSKGRGLNMTLAATATDGNLEPSAIDGIKAMGIPCVNFSVDDVVAMDQIKNIGKHFDLHWTTFLGTEKELKNKYGCRVIHLPMAANPYFFRRTNNSPEHIIAFVGSRYGARGSYIEALEKASVPIRVRGNGWCYKSTNENSRSKTSMTSKLNVLQKLFRSSNGRKLLYGAIKTRFSPQQTNRALFDNTDFDNGVSLEEMVQIYNTCTVSLGVLEVGNTHTLKRPLYQYRLREFETTMIGCAHIVYRIPDLEVAFEEDKEIIFYSSKDECIDKARFYLSPKRYELCNIIGNNASYKSRQNHTWLMRFERIWKELGIA